MKKATVNTLINAAISITAIAALFGIGLCCLELGEPYITWFVSVWIGIMVVAILYFTGLLKAMYKKFFK